MSKKKENKKVSIEEIEEMAFGKMERVHKDIQRVFNVPRQSAIKALLRDGLDQYYIKSQARKSR